MRRKLQPLAVAALLALTGCSPQPPAPPEHLIVGIEGAFTSYNSQSATGHTVGNLSVMNRVTPGFWRESPDGGIDTGNAVGSYEKVSDTPLTVRYSFAEDATWSDGDPLDCDDAWLAWVANSAQSGFLSADTAGYRLISSLDCNDGAKSFTVTYSEPFADWATLFGSMLPAHVVERAAGVADFIAAARTGDTPALQRASQFWNTGWNSPGALDPALLPAAGPYRIESWGPDSVTLVANDEWWQEAPKVPQIVLRSTDQGPAVQGLTDGTLDVIAGTPTSRALSELQSADQPYQVGASFLASNLVLNLKAMVFADPAVREAFAACVPRDRIVSEVVLPRYPDAKVLDSRFLMPFQPGYDRVTQQPRLTGSATGTVRVGSDGSTAQQAVLSLIRQACVSAGFTIVDAADPGFLQQDGGLAKGEYDAALVPALNSPQVTAGVDRYATGGAANYSGYQSNEVDDLLYALSTTIDRDDQVTVINHLEEILWRDLPSIPLFSYPTLAAWREDVSGVRLSPSPGGLTWNLEDWE